MSGIFPREFNWVLQRGRYTAVPQRPAVIPPMSDVFAQYGADSLAHRARQIEESSGMAKRSSASESVTRAATKALIVATLWNRHPVHDERGERVVESEDAQIERLARLAGQICESSWPGEFDEAPEPPDSAS